MSDLLVGLKLHEIVLMFLGVILFVALTIILVVKALKDKAIKSLIAFFLFPIVMIGYPSIKSFSFMDLKVELEEASQQVSANPGDTVAVKRLYEVLDKVDFGRIKNDPQFLVDVAKAHSSLGNYDSALRYTDKALALAPDDSGAKDAEADIQEKIKIRRDYYKVVEQLNGIMSAATEPTQQDVNKASSLLSSIEPPTYVDQESAIVVAKAFSFVDEKQKALQAARRVTESQVSPAVGKELKQTIQSDTVSKPVVDPALRQRLEHSEISNVPPTKMIIKRHYQL